MPLSTCAGARSNDRVRYLPARIGGSIAVTTLPLLQEAAGELALLLG